MRTELVGSCSIILAVYAFVKLAPPDFASATVAAVLGALVVEVLRRPSRRR